MKDDPAQVALLERALRGTGWWQAPDIPRYPGAPDILQYRVARATELHQAMQKVGIKVEQRSQSQADDPPIQPIIVDQVGVERFRANEIVRYLLDAGPFDLNQIATMPFTVEDREQFAMLIGYSVGGIGELSYVRDDTIERIDALTLKEVTT